MGDLAFELNPEVLRTRDAQFAAHPTQPLDSSTLLVAEIKRVRDLDGASALLDTNTEAERRWDGDRAT